MTESGCNGTGGCGSGGCASQKINKQLTSPPTRQDMGRMILSLTVVALLSAVILGIIYYYTEPIRLVNVSNHESQTLRSLLNLPESATIDEVRRYQANDLSVFYLTPKLSLHLNQDGKELERKTTEAHSSEEADAWMRSQNPSMDLRFVGRFFVAKENGSLKGYIVEGETQGYKSKIRFFIALNSEFQVQGVEILEQEEDPGLGAEIAKAFFKNQFAGRSAKEIAELEVTKTPQDPEWRKALQELGATPFAVWFEKNRRLVEEHPKVNAITGATISSESLTRGVKTAVDHFQKRLELMKDAL